MNMFLPVFCYNLANLYKYLGEAILGGEVNLQPLVTVKVFGHPASIEGLYK